jgi:hypothetical protein
MITEYRDLATPKLRAMLAALAPAQRRAMLARLGKELEVRLKRHFLARDQEGNARGWPRSHWWAREVRDKTALRQRTITRCSSSPSSTAPSPAAKAMPNSSACSAKPPRRPSLMAQGDNHTQPCRPLSTPPAH